MKRQNFNSDDEFLIWVFENREQWSTWQRVVDFINAELEINKSERWARRKCIELLKLSPDDYQDYQREIAKKVNQKQRASLNKHFNEIASNRYQIEELTRAIRETERLPIPEFKDKPKKQGKIEWLLAFGDIHYGKKFKSITNEYSPFICKNRMSTIISSLIPIFAKESIGKLKVLTMGDLIEGETLRPGQNKRLESDYGIINQTIEFQRILAAWLNELSRSVDIDYCAVKRSNHSQIRPQGSKDTDYDDEDIERLIHAYIEALLENNKSIIINTDDKVHTQFDIAGFKCLAIHGHKNKSYDINLLKDYSFKYWQLFDYAFIAHTHSYSLTASGENKNGNCQTIRVPSVMGSDEYADELLVGSKPGALLMGFEKNVGKVITYELYL